MGCLNTSNTPQFLVEPSFAQGLVFSQHMHLMSQHNAGNSFFSSFFCSFWTQSCQNGMLEHNQHTLAIVFTFFKVHLLVFEDGNIKKKDLPNDSAWRPIRIKVEREIVRTREEVEGADVLNDAVLEPDSDDEDIWKILQSGNDSKFLWPFPPLLLQP